MHWIRFFYVAILLVIGSSTLSSCTSGETAASQSVNTITYTVTPSTDSNESPSPSTAQTISSGATVLFTVTPNSGYANSTAGGTCPTGSWTGSVYTTGAITSNCTVNFTGVLSSTTYTVTPSASDALETVSPSTAQTVTVGSTTAFTVTANSGYTINSTVGGTCATGTWSGSVYTTGAITANCTVDFAVTSRSLTAFTSQTATTITSYFISPLTNKLGSSACNADFYPGDTGTNCTAYTRTCTRVTENTSTCLAARQALGLSGNWLLFSCNVIEGLAYKSGSTYISTSVYGDATYISLTTMDLPTYLSNYYPTTGSYSFSANNYTVNGTYDSLYTPYTTAFPDPGSIAQPTETITMYVPITPVQCSGTGCSSGSSSTNVMNMGPVGMAINGVYIFSSEAASTDNIFAEDGSFDQCDAHPAGSQYHYHSEPYSISYNDDNFIGVMMDGFWVYGRKDSDSSIPGSLANEESPNDTSAANTIYFFGGHVGTLPNISGTTQFHYHATQWIGCYDETSGSADGYTFQDNGLTYDKYNSATFSSTTGPATPSGGGNTYCGGTWVDAWFLTGHGNGGTFETPSNIGNGGKPGATPVWTSSTSTISSTSYNAPAPNWSCGGSGSTACFSQTTAGERYFYGTPGSCPNCNSDNH